MNQEKKSKRLDLQGIRGMAILSVIGFHFYPNIFPNGYLGVDQFFVLSGFLMCMLLKKAENMQRYSLIILFYSKRFKRILPLYLLIILLIMISLYTIFPDSAILTNQQSAEKALLFVSNRPKTEEEDYFQRLSIAIDLFTHTWSLSVEIQFYFLIPILFIFGNCLPNIYSQLIYYWIFGLSSLSYHFLSPPSVSFNSVFSRIWQFLIGVSVYLISIKSTDKKNKYALITRLEEGKEEDEMSLIEDDQEEEIEEKKETKGNEPSILIFSKYHFLIPMIFILLYPIPFIPLIVRPIITIFTGCLMYLSTDDPFLSNRILTYIGDISYSLYLIHWPIYAYCKLTWESNQIAIITGVVVSFILAVIVFETFEKWYLKLSSMSTGLLVVILLLSNVVLVNKDNINDMLTPVDNQRNISRLDGVTPNMTIDDAARLNKRWNTKDIEDLAEPGCVSRTPGHGRWCDYPGVENGKYKIVFFGNSYTYNHRKMVLQECRHMAYNVTMDSERGCEPLAALTSDAPCVKKLPEFVQFIESAKPDYAFMFTRFFAVGEPKIKNMSDIESDETYQQMKSQLDKMIPNIKIKLFILDSFPRINRFYIGKLTDDLKKGRSRTDINKDLIRPDGFDRGRIRHAELMKYCGSKCQLIDYLPLLKDTKTQEFRYFDDIGFSYFTSPNHLSAHGIELVRPLYTDICTHL